VPTYAALNNDILTSDADHRRLSIIGVALSKANNLDKGLNISNKEKIMWLMHVIVDENDIDAMRYG
jgi:hypothetical protein